MRDQTAPDLAKGDASVRVKKVGLVMVYEVFHPVEPLVLPIGHIAIAATIERVGWMVKRTQTRVRPIVGHAREGTMFIGAMTRLEPATAVTEMLGDAESHALLEGGLLPRADHVALWSHLQGVPAVKLRVPQIEVVTVNRLGNKVPCAGFAVKFHQPVRLPFFRFPERDDVFVANF